MIKTIKDFELKGKKVLIRCDFNVPIKDGEIKDDNRLKESLKTINYALDQGAKVIIFSHLGRVKTPEDKEKLSLGIVAEKLSFYLNKQVAFPGETRGIKLEDSISNMKDRDVLLVENTRFEDLNEKAESKNDQTLGKYWASLGEIFINDAFGTAHRAHASNVGIANNLSDVGVGFLIEKELINFKKVLESPEKPFSLILGGAKVSDKIGVIENLVHKVDNIIIGGGMAYTFLKAKGYEVGNSLLEEEYIDFCKEMLVKYSDKIILPVDNILAKSIDDELGYYASSDSINEDMMGVDIGDETIANFLEVLSESKTVVWNGPLGVFEHDSFSKGTKEVFKGIVDTGKTIIVGGGDTASAAINLGFKDKITHISTGGGASLELLEGKDLPGIKVLNK